MLRTTQLIIYFKNYSNAYQINQSPLLGITLLGFYVAYRGKNKKFCPIRTRCADRTFWDNRTSNRSSRVGSTHDSQNRSETQVCKTSDLRYNNSMSYGKHIRPQIAPINSTPLIPKSG